MRRFQRRETEPRHDAAELGSQKVQIFEIDQHPDVEGNADVERPAPLRSDGSADDEAAAVIGHDVGREDRNEPRLTPGVEQQAEDGERDVLPRQQEVAEEEAREKIKQELDRTEHHDTRTIILHSRAATEAAQASGRAICDTSQRSMIASTAAVAP
jgi:hypothetical protein